VVKKPRVMLDMGDGFEIEVVGDAEAEKAVYAVCSPASWPAHFIDDQFGICCACGCAVRFRPYMPVKPAKICVPCIHDLVKRSQ
jgi:hypothetical protein